MANEGLPPQTPHLTSCFPSPDFLLPPELPNLQHALDVHRGHDLLRQLPVHARRVPHDGPEEVAGHKGRNHHDMTAAREARGLLPEGGPPRPTRKALACGDHASHLSLDTLITMTTASSSGEPPRIPLVLLIGEAASLGGMRPRTET